MSARKLLLSGAATAALAGTASAQLGRAPAIPAGAATAGMVPSSVLNGVVPPPGLGLGVGPGAQLPGSANTIWARLGISQEQREFCRRKNCRTPAGQLMARIQNPLSTLTGGLIPQYCPTTPSIAELQDPGAIGAASKVKLDRAGAEERIKAVKYLAGVDCHYWPEAEEALIGALRGDRNECVRYEAAMALLSGCCCTPKVTMALCHTVSCSDKDGFPYEKSARVRAVAAHALTKCLENVCGPNCGGGEAMELSPPEPAPAPAAAPEKKEAEKKEADKAEKAKEEPKERAAEPKKKDPVDEKMKPADPPKTDDKKKAQLGDPEYPREYYARVPRLPREQIAATGRRALELGARIGYTIVNEVNPNDYAAAGLPPVREQVASKPTSLVEMFNWKDSGAAISRPTPPLSFPLGTQPTVAPTVVAESPNVYSQPVASMPAMSMPTSPAPVVSLPSAMPTQSPIVTPWPSPAPVVSQPLPLVTAQPVPGVKPVVSNPVGTPATNLGTPSTPTASPRPVPVAVPVSTPSKAVPANLASRPSDLSGVSTPLIPAPLPTVTKPVTAAQKKELTLPTATPVKPIVDLPPPTLPSTAPIKKEVSLPTPSLPTPTVPSSKLSTAPVPTSSTPVPTPVNSLPAVVVPTTPSALPPVERITPAPMTSSLPTPVVPNVPAVNVTPVKKALPPEPSSIGGSGRPITQQ